MLSPSRKSATPRARLNHEITAHIRGVKGLCKHNAHHDMRQFYSHLSKPKPVEIEASGTLEERIQVLFTQKQAFAKPTLLKFRPGTRKSNGENQQVIEAGGRLIIPKQYYDKAVDLYDGTKEIYKELGLKETQEMQRNIDDIAERLLHKPGRKLVAKSRVYTPRSLTPQVKSASVLQTKCNHLLAVIESASRFEHSSRAATPLFWRSDLL